MAVSRPVHPRQPRQATRPEEQKVRVDEVGVIGRGEACEPIRVLARGTSWEVFAVNVEYVGRGSRKNPRHSVRNAGGCIPASR